MYTSKPGSSASKKTTLDNDKNVQKQKERMEKARDEKERIKMITERGIPASTQNYQPHTNSVITSSSGKRAT
jgi:hypothetical protein